MPIYQYECKNCGHSEEQLDSKPSEWHRCHCGAYLVNVIAAAHFKVNGASEANGYTIQKGNK